MSVTVLLVLQGSALGRRYSVLHVLLLIIIKTEKDDTLVLVRLPFNCCRRGYHFLTVAAELWLGAGGGSIGVLGDFFVWFSSSSASRFHSSSRSFSRFFSL